NKQMSQVLILDKEKIFERDARRKIYKFILKYPGLHLQELIRKLNLPNGTLRYHLRYLEKRNLIKAKPEDGYVRFYITNNIGNDQKKIFHILRQEVPRNIILYLLLLGCASQIELSKSLEKHPKTIEFHLKKLLNKGIIEIAPASNKGVHVEFGQLKIIERIPVTKEIIYRLKNPYSINDSVILYKKRSLNFNFFDILSDINGFFYPNDKPIRKAKGDKDSIEHFEKWVYEIFPHPYHA
ncbi:MAG: winged helix-turn-helix transcriptional regulator, partial [Thermoplasmatales archaeon]